MEIMKKLAYLFFLIIIAGLVVHMFEFYASSSTFSGLPIALTGMIGLIIVFAFHMNDRRSEKSEKFRWKITHIGVAAIILIGLGIVINVIASFFFREYLGIGNPFISWGFIVGAIGFFVFVVKEKAFKGTS